MPEFLLNFVQGGPTRSLFPPKQGQMDSALPQSQTKSPSSLFENLWGIFSLVLSLIYNIKESHFTFTSLLSQLSLSVF